MKMEPRIARRIVRNALLSLFLYALPVLLMFATFYLTNQRPWEKKAKKAQAVLTRK
ncbi:hypothetical protein IC230_06580 [Spirosoma sp. BT704]|uniref:Uncharacterized protein n=2 Tax=Spirosoma validum TaxID=2771355 RepID=A0A927GCH9_9BACT|nr:hypothetical protein [Spirosoma validum]